MNNDKSNTALLVMDMQTAMLGVVSTSDALIDNAAQAIAYARDNGIPVIYVILGFRAGAPEISVNNKSFSANKQMFTGLHFKEFTAIHPDLAPEEGECVVVKRRVSAFSGSDLEVVLRSFGIEHLILTGISTSGVVLSTVREAADKDYRITVLADCCADREEETHSFLTSKIFPRQADVLTVEEWINTKTK